jgi:hypothetical protein
MRIIKGVLQRYLFSLLSSKPYIFCGYRPFLYHSHKTMEFIEHS